MSEKTKNQAAALTLSILLSAIIWFPVIAVFYLIAILLVALSTDDFAVVVVVAAPIAITYLFCLCLVERKAVIKYVESRYKEIKNLFT